MTTLTAVALTAAIVAVACLTTLAAQWVMREVAALRESRQRSETAWDKAVARAGGLMCETESKTPVFDAVRREMGL